MSDIPDIKKWLSEAKASAGAKDCGMYLLHNGVVRASARSAVRGGKPCGPVMAMELSCDREKLRRFVSEAEKRPGIRLVKVWLNEGLLKVGDDIMYILVAGDIREHVSGCLLELVGNIKENCLIEKEL